MKVVRVETIACAEFPNLLWVRLHTDDGAVGLGETFFGPAAVASYIHETAAPYLLGLDPLATEQHHVVLTANMTHRAIGAEMRGLSALDIALWDLVGQHSGLPLYRCLGGPVRNRIRIYNTCAGSGYNTYRRVLPGSPSDTAWGIGDHAGPLEELAAWQEQDRAGELAVDLLANGITAMKIWPFDRFADETGGQHITPVQLEQGLRPFRQIREAVGSAMEIAVELHSRWELPAAIRIAAALEDIAPLWYEDPIRMDDPAALAEFARGTRVPITASETLAGRHAFRAFLERGAIGVVMVDPGWVGGVTEARRVANLAEAFHRPFAPHDCTGPVVFAVGVHLCLALPNAMIQEGVRAYYHGWYREVVAGLPVIDAGMAAPPPGPGLGTALAPGFLDRTDVSVRISAA